MYDCVIIGGGLIGMLSARELAQAGLSVALLEKGHTGRESTWAGGGILSPLYPWRYDEAVSALAGWSRQVYPGFAERLLQESGIDPEYRASGLLILDTEEKHLALDWAAKWQESMNLVGAKHIRELEPELGDVPEEALWLPGVAQVRNPRLAQALRKSIEKQGVKLIEQVQVTDLEVRNNKVVGVSCAGQNYAADKVVVAGGAWSAQILEGTGLEIPVRPVRGQMILFHGPVEKIRRIVLSRERYVIPRRDGRVLVGSTLEEVGFDKSTTETARKALLAEARRIIPALAEYEIEHHWAGLRPGSPHGIPYICRHPVIEGLYINTGHFRYGVVLGPASARLLADMMLGREPILEPKPYAIQLN